MSEPQSLCVHCGGRMSVGSTVCPNCGKAQTEEHVKLYLAEGTLLNATYRIGQVISVQTDSVLYAAQHLQTMQPVTVREFLPRTLITRAAGMDVTINRGSETLYQTTLDDFVRLWRTVRSLSEFDALPQVHDVFFAGGTAYAVCSNLDCITLESYLASPENRLTWDSACRIFMPVLRALGQLHACGILHAAISPQTLLVATDGKLHLGGFSVSQTKAQIPELHSVPTAGFAPIELYDSRICQGAYTDVYAVAAVMYNAITGEVLLSAEARAVGDDLLFTAYTANLLTTAGVQTLAAALQIYPQRRIRTMEQFIDRMENKPQPPRTAELASQKAAKQPAAPAAETPQPTRPALLALKVFACAVVVFALLFCTLYATVLYDKLEVPLLDKAFSALSFLPMNSETTTTAPTSAPTAPTSEAAKETLTVPNFKSLTYNTIAGNTTFNRNFTLNFVFEESDTVAKNSIIDQDVEPGTTVEQGTTITIRVSSGKPMIVLDDVVGMSYLDAYEVLTDKGFEVEKVMMRNDGTHTVGEVYTMSLVAGLSFEKGTRVTLSVWDGTSGAETAED